MPDDSQTQKPELPVTLQALKKIEQSQPSNATPAVNTAAPTPGDWKEKVKVWIEKLKKQHAAVKIAVGVFVIFAIIMSCCFVMFLTSMDTQVFKLTLDGTVVNDKEEPIANAKIKLDGKEATSNDQGKFVYEQLEVKRYVLEISAEGYEDFKQEIAMSRSFLNYVNNRVFELKPAGSASIIGKFISPDPSYQFLDDKVVIDGETYSVKVDGSFEISKLKTGEVEFSLDSINFKDETRTIDLKGGRLDLGEMTLTPAGDIVGNAISYIREDILADLKITVEGVPADQIIIDEAGAIRIKDLEVARKYKVRAEKAGYLTRDYEVSINQGENPIFGFKVVEAGRFPFIRKVSNREQLFVADFDGLNPLQLTQDLKSPQAEFALEDVVFYFTTRDNVTNSLSGIAYTTYVADSKGGNPQRVTEDTTGLGRQVPNFTAQKIANIKKGTTQTSRILEVMSLEGLNRVTIHQIDKGTFDDVAISNDGKVLYFHVQDEKDGTKGLYRTVIGSPTQKILEKENVQIYSVSDNGDRVLYSARNASSGLQDLFLHTFSTGQDTTLKVAFTGKQYQFVKGANDFVIFSDNRDGASNLFQLVISTNTEIKVSAFTAGEGVEAVYQQLGFVVYQTNKAIYLLDLSKPKLGKMVTSDFVRYTGYDF